jgi:integrase/recombinase XerD
MTAMRQAVADYLALRRSLGFKLVEPGYLLGDFARFMDQAGASHITTELALAWATRPAAGTPYGYWLRLSAVRGLAAHLHAVDPAHQVPPAGVLPRQQHRPAPYLFTEAEVSALMQAAGTLRGGLYAATYQTLIGLLVVTGLRPGEAIRLDVGHVDLSSALLTVAEGKYGKSRELALHPSTVEALAAYARVRDRLCPCPAARSFFISTAGTRLLLNRVDKVFAKLARQAGLRSRSARWGPRPIDLRHTFAVTALAGWYRAGADVGARLPLLSTWLGHARPASTYWYLQACPELLALATERMTRAQHAQENRQ